MRFNRHPALLVAVLATGVAFALTPAPAAAFAGDNVAATTDRGFVPNTGEINRGFDEKLPASSTARPIPTPAQARAAKLMPYPKQPSVGEQQTAQIPASDNMRQETKDGQATAGGPQATNSGGDAMQNGSHDSTASQPQKAIAGAAPRDDGAAPAQAAESHGPIGATGQTMPSKLSERNDVLDRVPIMAQPDTLSDQDRQQIFQAAMADKTRAATDAAKLAPASELTSQQALNETHPLPSSVRGIAGVQQLGYVKTKDKVFLVVPATRIVVDEIGS